MKVVCGNAMFCSGGLSLVLAAAAIVPLAGCSPGAGDRQALDRGILWVRDSAEFEALSLQAYRAAGDFLPQAVADSNWSALPGQTDAAELPAAIIFDVDETVVSNVAFQAVLQPPFRNSKLDDWNNANKATAVPGVVKFTEQARAAGVELYFVTNRPCERKPGVDDSCPQEAVTVQDLNEAGVPADPEHVMLANERPEWDREKSSRRNYVATTHRVIMLIGDDLGDFIPCTRRKPLSPCTEGATADSRRAATYENRTYWGAGWFVLPNPMHGSWTSVE